jgi:hypothetical protein
VAVSGGTVVVPERDRFGRPLTWRERQPVIVEQMGDLIELGLAQTRIAFEAGRLRDAQAGTIAAAVLIDKCQLLTGSATDRRESFTVHAGADEVARRIRELEAELGVTPRGEIE